MIDLRLHPRRRPRALHDYRVAERLVSADATLPQLGAFAVDAATGRRPLGEPRSESAAKAGRLVWSGEAELGRGRRDLECRWGAQGYWLAVAGVGRFAVAGDGGRITLETDGPAIDAAGVEEILLGPALILALALQDVWCLHASAVELDGRAVAFLGTSGAGKSTLGRALPELSADFGRLGDDILPLTLAHGVRPSGGPRALPHFPQLKHGPGDQPGAGVAGSLPLAAIYLLETVPGAGAVPGDGVAVEPLAGFAAALALVRHTVSARLFTAALLRRHTDFCARLAGSLPVRRLTYPRQWAILPRLEELLRRLTSDGRPT